MRKDDCIFCKIANGEIPSSAVYEDDDFRAIMDISPAAPGHVIILPKEHAANVFELPTELAAKVLPIAAKIAKAVQEETGCEGVNILQNNGEAAGQTVFHFHMHVIPRYFGDTVEIKWVNNKFSEDEFESTLDKIKEFI